MMQLPAIEEYAPVTREERAQKALDNPAVALRNVCHKRFHFFLKYFWPVVSHDEFQDNWHIEYLCDELQALAERVAAGLPKKYDLIINVPPGTTKTITCTVMFPIWCWTKWYWLKFIASSYSAPLSLESAELSRDVVRSSRFRDLFPEIAIKQGKEGKINYQIIKKRLDGSRVAGGNRYSTSVGGTLTGFHGHILIVDDPLNPNQAVSKKELRNANHWMDQTLPTRKTNKEVTPIILIMQRLHQDDPTGHTLKKHKENVKHICLPGETRQYGEFVRPKELKKLYVDNLLDPMRMNWKVLDDLKADLGQFGYASQIGQNPVPPEGGMFKVDHFQAVTNVKQEEIVRIVRYWDKAAGEEVDSAYTAGVKMAVLKNKKFAILDVKRGRWSSGEREDIIRSTAEADGPEVIIYHEQEPGSGGKDSAQATIRNLAGFTNFADRPTGNKVYRADPYSVQVENGNVLLLHGKWNDEFIDEHRNFPYSAFKDQVDAASGAFAKLATKREAGLLLGRRPRR